MKTAPIKIEDKVDKLLAVLDSDILHMQESLSRLNKMRSFVVKRDDTSLAKLLEGIQNESKNYKNNELNRRLIRKDLAIVLGCAAEQITLSRLENELAGAKKVQITERKTVLRSLIKKLKREHLSTKMLLSDCARFNKALLKGIFELGKTGTITYDSTGSTKSQTGTAFVDMRF